MNHNPATHGDEKKSARDTTGGQALEAHVDQLLIATEQILRHETHVLSELALIRRLQNRPWNLFGAVQFSDPASLYPVHFLLFHVLYRLRDELAEDGFTLSISPLAIHLGQSHIVGGSGMPDQEDKLRAFYLDLAGYQLPEEEINRMLDDFWAGRIRNGNGPGQEELTEASAILGFADVPDNFREIKQQFRRAVMQAHPDRGGNTEQIQRLNQAFSVLKAHFRSSAP